jgi:hypothetical protein
MTTPFVYRDKRRRASIGEIPWCMPTSASMAGLHMETYRLGAGGSLMNPVSAVEENQQSSSNLDSVVHLLIWMYFRIHKSPPT